MNEIIRFDLIKLNNSKKKLCTCTNNHYEIDTQNCLVYCLDCGATIDPYDALLNISRMASRLEWQLTGMINEIKENRDKLCRMKIFRNIENSYRFHDLLPVCPECGEPFDPTKIREFVNVKIVNISQEVTP